MTDLFLLADQIVAGIEAGLSLDPTDPGNWTGGEPNAGLLKGTKFGISAKEYPDIDIANLTLEEAQAIRRRDYWDKHSCGDMPWPWALGIYDGEINQGGGVVDMAQIVLGLKKIDAVVGPMTLAAMAEATPNLFDEFLALRGVAYSHLAQFTRDGKGWLTRLMRIARAAASHG